MRRYLSIFISAICCAALFSCSKDGNSEYKGESIDKLDDLEMFQNFIAEVDSTGKLVGRCYGTPLDLSDTTHLFIGVENLEEAEEIFLGWCSTGENVSITSSGILFSPTDMENNPQGKIYFDIDNGESGTIAEVSFSHDTDIKHVSRISFIKSNQWPSDEVHSPYLIGDFVRKKTAWNGDQNWVCIREAKPGVSGLLVFLSNDAHSTDGYKHYDLPTRSMYTEISKVLRQDWDNYVTMFYAAGNKLSDYHYWTKEIVVILVCVKRYTCILRTGEIRKWEILWAGRTPRLQYGQVETFGTVNQAQALQIRQATKVN